MGCEVSMYKEQYMSNNQGEQAVIDAWYDCLKKHNLTQREDMNQEKQYEIFCAFTLC